MPICIYNSLTRKKEEFKPLDNNKIRMYTCGVTVYDDCHIGHARSLYIFDVIRRYFKYREYKVNFIRNITDIDDKIINKAKELGKSAKEVAEEYIRHYREDIKALGIDEADKEPRATAYIKEMIKHIDGLIKKDYAYVIEGDVYFSVKKFKDYGKLSGQNLEQMIAGVRIEKDERKHDPLDFALWKKSKEDEPFWDSPWGKGRPGWHIECSVMSMKYLGDTFDIHAGGRDLIFPHHENEIAQSEALTNKPFARCWIHHGLLTINGQKMAKSLGNFITIQDAIKRYGVDELKLFFLSSHYSQPVDFNERKIKDSKEVYKTFDSFLKKKERHKFLKDSVTLLKSIAINEIKEYKNKFIEAMDDDFNTPEALSCLFQILNFANRILENGSIELKNKTQIFNSAEVVLKELSSIFGLGFSQGIPKEVKDLIRKRDVARRKKDFKLADDIRDLVEKTWNILLEDGPDGTSATYIKR